MLRLAADPKRWISVTAPVWASARWSPRLLDQKCRNNPVDDLQDRREKIGMGGEQRAQWDRPAVRLGMRQISGFREEVARRIETERSQRAFIDVEELCAHANLDTGIKPCSPMRVR